MSDRMASIELCDGCWLYYSECACGTEYAAHECAADGCGAILYYPDEGQACPDHTCGGCGAVVDALAAFSLPYRDERGMVYLDDSITACLACYGAIMETLSPDRMLSVQYKRRG